MTANVQDEKQNFTIRLSRQTIQKARVLAAEQSTSISGFLTRQIEDLAGSEDEYEEAMRGALALMEEGLDLDGSPRLGRDALHER
jgi:hypothetical protein